MNIKRQSFGFPINLSVDAELKNNELIFNKKLLEENQRLNLKIIIKCTIEDKKFLQDNEKTYISKIQKSFNNLENISITYNVQKENHIRSKKIIEAKSNIDKLIEYLNINEQEYKDSLLEKETEIENSLDIKHFLPCHSFTLLKVNLRGAIGIKEGSGKDEIEVDFTKYSEGIVALTGANGTGKSTFIENCHPYPQMLTRNGKLQDHFFLKDSHRNLLYIDENKNYYNINIEIDGKSKSGKCRYFVNKGNDINNLIPIKEIDGSSESYNEWVTNNFGSLDLFLNTAFYANRKTPSCPDISSATKGEKKSLFSSLLGIDSFALISKQAKELSKSIKQEIESAQLQIQEESNFDYDSKIKEYENIYEAKKNKIEDLKISLKELDVKIEEKEKLENNFQNIVNSLKVLRVEKNTILTNIEFVKTYNIEENAKKIDNWNKLRTFEENYNKWKTETYYPIQSVYNDLKNEVSEIKANYSILKNKIDNLQIQEIVDICPTCQQKLPEYKIVELKNIFTEKQKERNFCEKELERIKTVLNTKSLELENHKYKDLEIMLDKYEKEYKELKNSTLYLESYDDLSQKRNLFNSFNLSSLENSLNELTKKEIELENELKINSDISLKELKDKKEELNKNLEFLESSQRECLIDIGKYKSEKERNEHIISENKEIKETLKRLNKDFSEYQILEKAFGADGIQALELEALAPDIADMTNNILQTSYGDKFKISFQTLRQATDGHYIEDFSILVEDTKTGTQRPLEWLSGGESVWIKESLYHAFSVIRAKSTNFSINTKFLDEADGTLDSAARLKYLKMIETSHKESNAIYTILITHSQELKDIIEQQINF